jgi:phospholipase C
MGGQSLRMRPRSLAGVETIVLVMMENRSFDHLLGWMSLPPYGNRKEIEGLKGGIDSTSGELTEPAYQNRGRNKVWRPYMAKKDDWLVSDLPHGRSLVHIQMQNMRGFAEAQFQDNPKYPATGRPDSLMMMTPDLIPATSFLAREFMVCDHWFSPIPTDTHPNRLMSLCGYTKIDQTSGQRPPLPDHDSVLDWCDDRNIRWRVYRESLSFITIFTALRPHGLEADRVHFRGVSDLAHDFQKESAATFPQLVIVEPAYSDDPLVMNRSDFAAPARTERSTIEPTDNHPPNPMGYGERFLADVYRAVTTNRRRWEGTVMIVVYDEHGGFFDHVPPFKVTTRPPGFEDDHWVDKSPFLTSGPRVPAIIVSPLVPRASHSNVRLDHTSILQFLADVAEAGAYSKTVADRHDEGKIFSLSEVIEESPWQDKPPDMKTVRLSHSRPGASAAQAMTPSMQTFDNARKVLAQRKAAAAPEGPQIKLGARNYLAARHTTSSSGSS